MCIIKILDHTNNEYKTESQHIIESMSIIPAGVFEENIWYVTLLRRSLYHIETKPLVYPPNERTSLFMIGTSVMKELILSTLYS